MVALTRAYLHSKVRATTAFTPFPHHNDHLTAHKRGIHSPASRLARHTSTHNSSLACNASVIRRVCAGPAGSGGYGVWELSRCGGRRVSEGVESWSARTAVTWVFLHERLSCRNTHVHMFAQTYTRHESAHVTAVRALQVSTHVFPPLVCHKAASLIHRTRPNLRRCENVPPIRDVAKRRTRSGLAGLYGVRCARACDEEVLTYSMRARSWRLERFPGSTTSSSS